MQTNSLRVRKKQRTRLALMRAADRLFLTRGYDQTTLEEICAEVEVHVQTLLRYFGSKEELALARQREALDQFKLGLTEKPDDEDVVAYWHRFIVATIEPQWTEGLLDYIKVLETVPALRARYRDMQREYEDLIAEEMARESGNHVDLDLHARAKAATLISVHFGIARTLILSDHGEETGKRCLGATDAVMAAFPQPSAIPAFRPQPR